MSPQKRQPKNAKPVAAKKELTVIVSGPSADELHRLFPNAEMAWEHFAYGYFNKVYDLIYDGMRFFICDLSTKTGSAVARYVSTSHDYDEEIYPWHISVLRSEDQLQHLTEDEGFVWKSGVARHFGSLEAFADQAACVLSFDLYPDMVPVIQCARRLGIPVHHYDPRQLALDMLDDPYEVEKDD